MASNGAAVISCSASRIRSRRLRAPIGKNRQLIMSCPTKEKAEREERKNICAIGGGYTGQGAV